MKEIARRRPVDSTAARVTSRGVHYVPVELKPGGPAHSDVPLPMMKWHGPASGNLTGTRFGQFTVIGYAGTSSQRGARWMVQCACGMYSIRITRSIKNPANHDDRCERCRQQQFFRKRLAQSQNGQHE